MWQRSRVCSPDSVTPTLSILRALGFGDVAWSAGYVIGKPG